MIAVERVDFERSDASSTIESGSHQFSRDSPAPVVVSVPDCSANSPRRLLELLAQT